MNSNSANGPGPNDLRQTIVDQSATFEEEMNKADEYLQRVVRTIRAQDVPQGTEPAFQFRL
jgi:hypothetical protein